MARARSSGGPRTAAPTRKFSFVSGRRNGALTDSSERSSWDYRAGGGQRYDRSDSEPPVQGVFYCFGRRQHPHFWTTNSKRESTVEMMSILKHTLRTAERPGIALGLFEFPGLDARETR